MLLDMNPQDKDGLGSCPESGLGAGFTSDSEHVPRGDELKAELSRILSLASELESCNYLPDPKDDLARQRRAELKSKLSLELNKLQRYRVKLDREVLRCEKNLDRIHSDSEKLNLDETRQCYCEAESLQMKQYREAVLDRKAVLLAITKVQAVLSSSEGVGLPVADPFGSDLPTQPLPGSQSNPEQLGNEVDDLLDFGPLV
jgi:hypothetical protein